MIEVLLFLHILLVMFSFAFTAGLSIYLDRVGRTGDAKIIHAAFGAARPLTIIGAVGWLLTALAGAGLAGTMGVPMASTWLLYTYAAFAALMIVGFGLHLPWQKKVLAASAPFPRGDLGALLHAPIHRIASVLSALLILSIVFLMTAKLG